MRFFYSLKYKTGLCLASIVRFAISKKSDALICPQKNQEYFFLITSTINPIAKLHGHDKQKRSDFDTTSRFRQTIETIRSIRAKVPQATILLLENSDVSDQYRKQLELECTRVLYFSNDPVARFFRDSNNKGSGEAYMLIKALKKIQINGNSSVFKISGRYRLSESFNLASFSNEKFNFVHANGSISTRLYFVPDTMRQLYLRQLKSSFIATIFGVSLEDVIGRGLKPTDVIYVPIIGVTGYIGVDSRVLIDE